MSDGFEVRYSLNPLNPDDAAADNDGDGFTNKDEYLLRSDPLDAQSQPKRYQYFYESFEQPLSDEWALSGSEYFTAWSIGTNWATSGTHSLGITKLESGQYSSVKITRLYEAGTLTFDYRSFTGNVANRLYFIIDGVATPPDSTVINADFVFSRHLDAGVHTIELKLYKGSPSNTELVAIDALEFIGDEFTQDYDADGMPDKWEIEHGLNPTDPADAAGDLDGDGVTNLGEYLKNTDPTMPNTDVAVKMAKLFETNNSLITYRVTVINNSNIDVSNLTLANMIPAELVDSMTYQVGADSTMSCALDATTNLVCPITLLAAKQQEVVTISVTTPDANTKYPFDSSVTTPGSDADPDNNFVTGNFAGSFYWVGLVMLSLFAYLRRRHGR